MQAGSCNLLTELHIQAVIHQAAAAERGTSTTITSIIKLSVLLWFPCLIRVITGQTRANLLQSALRLEKEKQISVNTARLTGVRLLLCSTAL